MEDLLTLIYILLVVFLLLVVFVMPIVAVILSLLTRRKLNQRLARIEAAHGLSPMQVGQTTNLAQLEARLKRLETIVSGALPPPVTEVVTPPPVLVPKPTPTPAEASVPPPAPAIEPVRTFSANDIESMIGRRWVGWAAVLLILFATAFFLKYAFDNRWIGEVGRVTIGIAFGVVMTSLGLKYFKRGWRIFSQILTGGGVTLLYLSAYAAFGYYHLVPQKAAFLFLALLVAEAAGLALLYQAPSIAIMALIGGFLTPLLLHSNRDQYVGFFGYIIALDLGALALLKHWRGLRTIAFLGSHLLFWLWYDQNYHEQKLGAVLLFQLCLFVIFLAAHLASRLLRRTKTSTYEDLWLLLVNPFAFFPTAYHLLNPQYHDWMGVFAIGMALVYAGAAKLLLQRGDVRRMELLALIAVALTFVTIAIPIQLRSNWITIAWAIEALLMLWAGLETGAQRLRISAFALFGMALTRLLLWDTPYGYRPMFIPIFNRYFLSSLAVIACIFGAAALYQHLGKRKGIESKGLKLGILFAAVGALWIVSTIETFTFFQARALAQRLIEDAPQQRWLGQMAVSVAWAVYAAVLAAIGFVRKSSAVRWASLALFTVTVIKAMIIDIASLQQLYRIIVFFVLGLLLLLVAWAYHRVFNARESSI
jgi:uncharacterized membrane protein